MPFRLACAVEGLFRKPPMTKEQYEIIHQTIGQVDWVKEDQGFCRCPGERLHTKRTGKHDCRVWMEPFFTLFCFHGSCSNVVGQINKKIRRSFFYLSKGIKSPEEFRKRIKTPEEIEEERIWRENKKLEAWARSEKTRLKDDFHWSFRQMMEDSPVRVPFNPQDQYCSFLNMFQDDDVVWIGDTTDSSSKHDGFRNHFRSISEWRKINEPIGCFTCPSVFKKETHSRSNSNIHYSPYLVVESDVLSKDEICCVFRWLCQHLKLKMIVDTAGKSLHGWFVRPAEKIMKQLKLILPIFDCDIALFKLSQPVRIPGAMRGDRMQAIVWKESL